MAINAVFSDANAGRLQVTLSGTFVQGTNRDAGFPQGASNVLVAVSVNGVNSPAIDRYAPTTTFSLDYPGGNANWSIVSTVLANSYGGGTTSYGFQSLKCNLTLFKK